MATTHTIYPYLLGFISLDIMGTYGDVQSFCVELTWTQLYVFCIRLLVWPPGDIPLGG